MSEFLRYDFALKKLVSTGESNAPKAHAEFGKYTQSATGVIKAAAIARQQYPELALCKDPETNLPIFPTRDRDACALAAIRKAQLRKQNPVEGEENVAAISSSSESENEEAAKSKDGDHAPSVCASARSPFTSEDESDGCNYRGGLKMRGRQMKKAEPCLKGTVHTFEQLSDSDEGGLTTTDDECDGGMRKAIKLNLRRRGHNRKRDQ